MSIFDKASICKVCGVSYADHTHAQRIAHDDIPVEEVLKTEKGRKEMANLETICPWCQKKFMDHTPREFHACFRTR